jgi:hypothetical protein
VWREEEVADDDETWGKSSTRSRRASVCEESPNGWWSWQITDGGGSPRCLGNQAKKGRKLHRLRVFIAGGEREWSRARSLAAGHKRLAGSAGPWLASPSPVLDR